MSTESTTVEIPTPAQEAYNLAKVGSESERVGFYLTEGSRLRAEATKDEVIALALKAEPWLQKSKVTTKDKAINIVVRKRWEETETAKSLEALSIAASVERRTIKRAETAAERVEMARTRLLEVAGNPWEAERTIERTAHLRQEAVAQQHWNEVLHVARQTGVGPVDALRTVLGEAKRDLLFGRNHRVMSRSTSLSANLITDLDTEALVAWIDNASDLLKG